VNGSRVVALFHWSKDRGREALQICNKPSLFCPALLWRGFRIKTIPLWRDDRTCLDFSRKGAEIPTFFFYSGFLTRFKHPALGQIVRQIRGTLSIGIILANLTEMGPLSWFFLRFSWNLKGDEKSKTKGHQSGFMEDSLGISWSF